jgi:DNA-binding transcriptional LysR family regulator
MNKIDLHRVDLNLLVTFEVLMTERHVGRTARRLGVSQSAVSHSLGRLRELFNDPLFVRHQKGIEPTQRSVLLGVSIADALSRVRGLLETGPHFDPNRHHRFTIGLTDGSVSILVALLERLRNRTPNIELQVRLVDSSAVVGAIDRQEIDLAFSFISPRPYPKRIAQTTALEIRHICLARRTHPILQKTQNSPEEFASLPHLAISPRGDPTTLIDDLLAEAGFRRNTVLTIPHFLAAPLIVARTDLVAIIDRSIARLFDSDPNLTAFELPISLRRVTIELLTSVGRAEDAALKWFHDECMAACRSVAD